MTLKPEYLEKVLTLLTTHQVTHFKMGDLELSLSPPKDPIQKLHVEPKPEAQLFAEPDLRADDVMSVDALTNWSSPDYTGSLPLTGEENV